MCQSNTNFDTAQLPETMTVYKIVRYCPEIVWANRIIKDVFQSPNYVQYEWKQGLNLSSRLEAKPTEDELKSKNKEVNNGFHFYIKREDAELVKKECDKHADIWNPNNKHVIIICEIKRENMVGTGTIEWAPTVADQWKCIFPTIVATQCIVNELPKE